eukprot:2814616-Lingulodinium_polyedra.AAC.1
MGQGTLGAVRRPRGRAEAADFHQLGPWARGALPGVRDPRAARRPPIGAPGRQTAMYSDARRARRPRRRGRG